MIRVVIGLDKTCLQSKPLFHTVPAGKGGLSFDFEIWQD